MKFENNKIVEATKHELFQHYLNKAYYLLMDYDNYIRQCIKNGTKIIDEKSETDKAHDVDKVEVVRCRDCKYSEVVCYYDGSETRICRVLSAWISTYDDDFCSRGERREEKNNEIVN